MTSMQINTSVSAYQAYTPQAINSAGSNQNNESQLNAALNPEDTVTISSAALETGERMVPIPPKDPVSDRPPD